MSRNFFSYFLIISAVLSAPSVIVASLITFEFNNDTAPNGVAKIFEDFGTNGDGNSVGSTTVGGLTITALAGRSGSNTDAEFNATAGNTDFGINIGGDGSDESDRFDGGAGNEFMVFSFDKPVYFSVLDLSGVSWDDDSDYEAAELSVSGGASYTFTDDDGLSSVSGITSFGSGDSYNFGATELFIAANTDITLGYNQVGGGNGWRIDAFTVNAIPEPASIFLILGCFAIFGLFQMKRRISRSGSSSVVE